MKKEVFTVGQSIEAMCSACDGEQTHTVRSATKQGSVTEIACDTCEMVTAFSRGVKTAITAGKGKAASAYDRTRTYKKGQAMMHDTFGRGEVTAVVSPNKIDVLFGDRTRRMIHAQN